MALPLLPFLLLGGLLVAGRRRGAAGDTGSAGEPVPVGELSLPVDPAWLPAVSASLVPGRWLYYWGGPSPVNPPGLARGVPYQGQVYGDCSGAGRVLLISGGAAGLELPRFSSGAVPTAAYFRGVSDAEIRPGDVLLYGGHVTVVVGGSGRSGCTVWSMSGGGSSTFGNNPEARPRLYKGADYRKDFKGAYRLV